jgi:hypothetical protein
VGDAVFPGNSVRGLLGASLLGPTLTLYILAGNLEIAIEAKARNEHI